MKRNLLATAAILVLFGAPAHAQVSGIDTTTTPSTDASIDIEPPAMETGADIMADGQPYPDSVLDLEARGETDMDLPDAPDAETNADADTVDPSLPVPPTVEGDVESQVAPSIGDEFEPEPDLDIGAQLDLKIDNQ